MLSNEEVEYFKNHQNEITPDLLTALRANGKPGKQQVLDILDMPKDEENYYLDAFGNRISLNGDRVLKKPYTQLKLSNIHILEIEKCVNDPLYFIQNYIKVMTKEGTDFLDFRKYQIDYLKILANPENEAILSLLPRQSGKSVITGTWLTHSFAFAKDINIGIVANKSAMAREFLDKCKNMLINLPMWLKPGVQVWNKGSIRSESNVNILTDVSNDSSLRGWSINFLIVDETDWINPADFYAMRDSLTPTQAGLSTKKNVYLTTPNGKRQFYDMWKDAGYTAEESGNGFLKFDVDWKVVPRYKSDGSLWDPEEFKEYIIKKDGPQVFYQNYACSFLGSSFTLIPDEILATFRTKEAIDLDIRGQLKIYENPIPNHKYIIGVDSSKEGQDFTGIQIFDIEDLNFRQVGSAKLKIDYLMIPEILNEYGLKYNSALIIIENNEGSGQSIADILARDYEYDNVYYEYRLFKGVRKRLPYPGFRTTKLTRDLMLQVLRMVACANRLELCDSETIKEFETFALVKGKYQADGANAHDDLVMATLMCFSIFKDSKTFEDVKVVVDGLKSGESISADTLGLSFGAFSDFGTETQDYGHYRDFDDFDYDSDSEFAL